MPAPSPVVTRFAPSPTGRLHLGHARAAFVAHDAARAAGGRFLVRIEDIDATRCRPEHEAAILEDLAWLGLAWESPIRRQSEHFDDYAAALERLDSQGLLYPCTCTRADIRAAAGAPQGHVETGAPAGAEAPLYPGTCRARGTGERRAIRDGGATFALRLDVAAARAIAGPLTWRDRGRGTQDARPELLGDVVLARKETPTSYHLAVTVDDAIQGVTLVTRGEDLFESTHVHRLIQALLDLPVPEWSHHGLVRDASGQRLAKRDAAPTLAALRASGVSAAEIRERAL